MVFNHDLEAFLFNSVNTEWPSIRDLCKVLGLQKQSGRVPALKECSIPGRRQTPQQITAQCGAVTEVHFKCCGSTGKGAVRRSAGGQVCHGKQSGPSRVLKLSVSQMKWVGHARRKLLRGQRS